MIITSVNYAVKDISSEPLLMSTGPGRMPRVLLSPISTEVLKGTLSDKIVIVFSRGPLNLTPLIASLQVLKHKGDILVGLPRKNFNTQNEKYSNEFSSLFRDNGLFFYRNNLWCTAEIEKTSTKLSLKDVRKRPRVGTRVFKNDYVEQLEKQLENGECSDWPRIVCTPIDYEIPNELFGETKFSLSNKVINLMPFSPKYFIFESVNERIQSIESLVPLIESLIEKKQWGVIHFSWPYPSGLSGFMKGVAKIRENTPDKILTFHLGIRYCLEVKEDVKKMVSVIDREGRDANTFIKNHHGFRDFSIEGEQWDYYYPTDPGSLLENIFIGVLGPNNNNYGGLIYTVGPFDGLLDQLRFEIGLENPSNTDPRILRIVQFPPFIDSFALPRETKMSVKLDTGEYRSIPLQELLSKKTPEGFSSIGSFTTLCHCLDTVRDLQNELNGLSSHCYPSKSYGSMSYIYRNLIDPRPSILNLVLGIYYPLPGTKKAILERIINLLETLRRKPELSKMEIDLTQYCSLFTNNGLRLNPQNKFEEIKKLQYEVYSHYGEQIIDVDISYVKGSDYSQKKKVKILCSDFSRLNNQLNRLEACNTDLLLPGPVPMFYFDDDTPKITRGFDVIYRPLRKIVFLTYPGNNLMRCVSQLNMMADIAVGPLSSPLVKKDLKTSLANNPHMFKIKEGDLDKCPWGEVEIDFDTPEDNVVDSSVLTTFASSKSIDDINQVLTLKDIWKSVSTTPPSVQKRYESNKENEILSIQVEFVQDAHKEIILLNANTYVRKLLDGKNSEVMLSRNIQSGDLIAYLRNDDRESLDNLFIRSFSESRGWTLEQVLEPFTCLHYFYESIRRTDFEEDFDASTFSNCYWLSIEQKEAVYDSLKLLLNNNIEPEEFVVKFRKSVERFEHWQDLGKLNDEGVRNLKTSFYLTKGIGPDKIHSLAVLFGLDYDINSFKSLLSKLRTGGKQYYFQKPKNLLAIGKLIGSQRTFDRYDDLTEAGKEIRTVLELEGLSISRVISGNDNPMNAMDDLIRKRMVICRVLEISQPSLL